MLNLHSIGLMTLAAALTAVPVLAQQSAQTAPSGVVATTNNPNLAVATVKLESGLRSTKIIGAAVNSDQNERIGTVDDLIITGGDKVTVAIISVGGVLGLGSKLLAVPYGQLKVDGDRVTLPGATKDTLNAMPSFVY